MEPNPTIPWNVKGKNGIKCFFSEETYSRFLGKDTFESRLERSLKKVGIHLPPLLENFQYESVVTHTDAENDSKLENEDESIDQSEAVDLQDNKDKGQDITDSLNETKNKNDSARQTQSVSQKDVPKTGSAMETQLELDSHKGNETVSIKSNVSALSDEIHTTNGKKPGKSINKKGYNAVPPPGFAGQKQTSEVESKTKVHIIDSKTDTLPSQTPDVVQETSEKPKLVAEKTERKLPHIEDDVIGVSDNKKLKQSGNEATGVKDEIKDTGTDKDTKEKKFFEKKRDSFPHDRMRYDKLGQYIPCIVSMKPRSFSSLLYKEQHRYLTLTHKYRMGFPNYPTEKEMKEVEEFRELERRVKEEQVEFNKFLKETSVRCAEDYNYISPDCKRYVEEKLSHVLPRVNLYPRYYNLMEKINLTLPNQQTGPVLQFVRPLLELGVVPKAVLPGMIPNSPLPVTARSYNQVNESFPATKPTMKGEHVWNHEPCSRDPNAEELGMRYGINIVMSAAALKSLVDTQDPDWGKHWEIPVTVREYDVFDGKKKIKHKVVYLDKPVYQTSSLTTRDKNFIFYKNALKALIIRSKQKGHVFTNVKTHLLQTSATNLGSIKSDVHGPDRDLNDIQNSPSVDKQRSANESKPNPNVSPRPTDVIKDSLKRKIMNKRKNGENIHSDSTSEAGGKTEAGIDSHKLNIQEGTGNELKSKETSEIDTNEQVVPEKGKKTAGGMFDLDSEAIDDLETFGMEKSWKSMLKGKQNMTSGPGVVKTSEKDKLTHGSAISELEKLKSELKGLESKAKKETEKVHNLGITTPPGKFYSSGAAKKPTSSIGLASPNVETPPSDPSCSRSEGAKCAIEMPTKQDSSKKAKILDDPIKGSSDLVEASSDKTVSKQVSNLNTVEKLSSTLQLSSGLNLKRNTAAPDADPALGKLVDKGTKTQLKQPVLDSQDGKRNPKTYPLRNKKSVTSKHLDLAKQKCEEIRNVAEEGNDTNESCDDDDDGLVIDVPDVPKPSKLPSLTVDGNDTPESPPASPSNSCPASPIMDNPASPSNDTPVSPDKTGFSPRGVGLRSTCVIIPLGDDTMDQNVIDHSVIPVDHIDTKLEIKAENKTLRKETDIQSFEKLLMNPISNISSKTMVIDNDANASEASSTKSTDAEKQAANKVESGFEVPKRRSSLRSAGKIVEDINGTSTSGAVQTRRKTRLSRGNEHSQNDISKEESNDNDGNASSDLTEAKTEKNIVAQDTQAVGPCTRRRHSEIMVKNKELQENIRLTRSRSSSSDKHEEHKTSPRPDRRVTRHSLDSLQIKETSTEVDSDLPVVRKKRKPNVIESDEEEETEMETSQPGTSQSVKDIIAEKRKAATAKRQPVKKGRPQKVKKSDNTAEADKIKELAEKLKKQIKEKHDKELSEVKQSGDVGLSNETKELSDTKQFAETDEKTNCKTKENMDQVGRTDNGTESNIASNKEGIKNLVTDAGKNQITTHSKGTPRAEDVHSETVRSNQTKNSTEVPTITPPVKGSGKSESSTNLDSILNMQKEMLKPSSSQSAQESFAAKSGLTNLAFPVSGNVIYTQWNLGGIHVMIRCSQHGNIKDAKHKSGYLYVTPKLEYQSVYGVEQETISEIARNWISVYVRPTCSLLRARINVFTSEVLLLEEMDYQSLLPPNTTFSQLKAFGQLHKVCQKLNGLSTGSYLLTHTPGEDDINLMKSTEGNKRGAYDLHFRHTNMMGTSEVRARPWLPLDATILTPQHRKMGRIPLTFQPKDSHVNKKVCGKSRKKKKQRLGEL